MNYRVGFLADIHGNSPALQAVLSDVEREGCAEVFFLGDIVNGIDPQGSVQLLRAWAKDTNTKLSCIRGNAEAYLLTPNRDLLPLENISWQTDMVRLIQWYEDWLSESELEWLRSFPTVMRWRDTYLVHDSPIDHLEMERSNPDISSAYREWYYHSRGILPDMETEDWRKLLKYMEKEKIVSIFCGHTHIPFYKEIGTKRICNVGSVGAPLDGDPRAAWVMMVEKPGGDQKVSIRRVAYDIEKVLRLIDETPDYPDFKTPDIQAAYKKWILTGIHWKAHLADTNS
jgi:predicted phosphodiesterase